MDDKSKCFDETMNKKELTVIDMHAGGSPMRIVTNGLPKIFGSSYEERLSFFRKNYDYIRIYLTNEPRGYREMTAIIPIQHDEGSADFGVMFLASTTYLPFCGEATICTSRYLVDHGIIKYQEPEVVFTLQAPSGLVECHVTCADGKAADVYFQGPPSFVCSLNSTLTLPNNHTAQANVAFGSGNLYVIVNEKELNLDLDNFDYRKHLDIPEMIENAANEQIKLGHMFDGQEEPLDGSIIRQNTPGAKSSVHLVTVDKGLVNRGFCGSASIACCTLDYFSGHLKLGETKKYASVVTKVTASATPIKECKSNGYDAVIIEIRGKGYYTGKHSFTFEKDDPLRKGFLG